MLGMLGEAQRHAGKLAAANGIAVPDERGARQKTDAPGKQGRRAKERIR